MANIRRIAGFIISERVLNAQVPSLLLQPLVENAIKYAITQVEDGGMTTINAHEKGGELVLEVIDDGPGIDANEKNKGTGVGLRNTADRWDELYGDNQVFELGRCMDYGSRFEYRLKCRKKKVQSRLRQSGFSTRCSNTLVVPCCKDSYYSFREGCNVPLSSLFLSPSD